ncbi:4'-phosphopantetheinyl transferase family protein [Kribbella sp. CA-247076]|uniref:4'-phosphopantetheinyl transferase family protein n=1 Tax=Kribbella sp. CA-247076 TaxID=3239941 RepID=UPI003D8AF144
MGDSVHVWAAPAGAEPRAAAHNLLLDLAAELVGGSPVLRHEATGRPYVDGLDVSISHSRNLLAVAAAVTGPVGVDVEDVYPRAVSGLAARWFDPSELEWMARQPDELVAFLHLWTAKEAVGKALGLGLRRAGLRRCVPLPMPSDGAALAASRIASDGDLELAVAHLPTGQAAVLAVALPAATTDVLLTEHHGAALRRIVTSRTSFPVVVRGS